MRMLLYASFASFLMLFDASPAGAQTFPARGIDIYTQLIANNPVNCASDDQRRTVAKKIAEQFRFEFGPTWGWKSADPGRPPSKDAVAQQDGAQLHGWEYQIGGSCAPYPSPVYHNLFGQTFIPVEPVNHLGATGPVEPPETTPPANGVVLARLDVISAQVALVEARVEAIYEQNERIFADEKLRQEHIETVVVELDRKVTSTWRKVLGFIRDPRVIAIVGGIFAGRFAWPDSTPAE